MSIPKSIHQIWMQGEKNIPEKYLENIKSIKRHNPGWSYKLWDEKEIRKVVSDLGKVYLDKFDSYKLLHQRVDMGRSAILYTFGGVSVDIDAFAHKGFDSTPHLNDSDFIVSQNSTRQFINNATILTSKNNPILKGLLDNMLTLDCMPVQADFQCIQATTGPIAFTKYLEGYKDQITVLDNKYFEPRSGHNAYGTIDKELTILDHQHTGSWLPESAKKILRSQYFFKRYWWIFALLLLIILILIFRKSS